MKRPAFFEHPPDLSGNDSRRFAPENGFFERPFFKRLFEKPLIFPEP